MSIFRRTATALVACAAIGAIGLLGPAGAAAAETAPRTAGLMTTASTAVAGTAWSTNSGQTAAGGYLQSSGVCGWGRFEFNVTAYDLDYVQFGVQAAGTDVLIGDLIPVGPVYRVTIPVPPNAGVSYYVIGWDWNATVGVWETVTVLTSFWVLANNDSLDGC